MVIEERWSLVKTLLRRGLRKSMVVGVAVTYVELKHGPRFDIQSPGATDARSLASRG